MGSHFPTYGSLTEGSQMLDRNRCAATQGEPPPHFMPGPQTPRKVPDVSSSPPPQPWALHAFSEAPARNLLEPPGH